MSKRSLSVSKPLVLDWADVEVVRENWGDKVNPVLAAKLSGRKIINKDDVTRYRGPIYSMIGSHLRNSSRRHIFWGTGFIDSRETISEPPRKVCAVRGPLSREKLLSLGVACPEVYGDAAILYPLFYFPKIRKRYDLGIIQHICDKRRKILPEKSSALKVKIIDIEAGVDEVVDQILACHRIASSSLHGIIASHAYGVPAIWLKLSSFPMGDGFKFQDYWASLGVNPVVPLDGKDAFNCEAIYEFRCPVKKAIDVDAFINACPFIDKKRMEKLRALATGRFRMGEIIGL